MNQSRVFAPSAGVGSGIAPLREGETASQRARAVLEADAAHGDPAVWIGGPCTERLLAQAGRLDAGLEEAGSGAQGGALQGVAFAVKDNIDVVGLPTTAACPAFARTAHETATAVERLEAAGAMLVGKTNLDQFATGLVGVRSPYGVPRNPVAPGRIPGGSSSGSAVAVAAGLVSFSLGTDTAGSGRVPAMCNGIVGLKPTRGLVSTRGVVPACRSLDCVSVFARSVEDAALVLGVVAGVDEGDPFSRAAPAGWSATPAAPAWPPRLGVPRDPGALFHGRAAPEAAYREALAEAEARGAVLVPVDWEPFAEAAALLYGGPWVAERWLVVADLLERDPAAVHPVVRRIVEAGAMPRASDLFRAQYRLAELTRGALAVFDGVDALLLPTAPFVPTLAEVEADPVGVNSQLGTTTNFVNLMDLAALAIPAGTDAEGVPFGVTLVGPAWSEASLGGIGLWLQGRAAPVAGRGAGPLVPVAVWGAHMSGLPLHGDLLRFGARHGAPVRTAPKYRLVALADGKRPGLLPGGDGSVEGELWWLPAGALGAFLGTVGAPLGLGEVELEDGRKVVGFVCAGEPAGATEISEIGSWKKYKAGLGE